MIGAIVLAAGRSRRMGTQKLLLPFAGQTVIGHVVDQLLAAADRLQLWSWFLAMAPRLPQRSPAAESNWSRIRSQTAKCLAPSAAACERCRRIATQRWSPWAINRP